MSKPDSNEATATISLVAKYGKQKIELNDLSPSTTIAQVKELIFEETNILPKRQKFIGLQVQPNLNTNPKSRQVTDDIQLSQLKPKYTFILMGTPEKDIFVDPNDTDTQFEVIDDFDLEFNAGTAEWIEHVAKGENLKRFTDSTAVHVMNEPREGKPLMVLDLDHTLLDFSRKSIEQASNAERAATDNGNNGNGSSTSIVRTTQETIDRMKRPYMDDFLARAYVNYDLVVWSQTSWRWLETKLIELNMLANPRYKFCFVLDKTSMFQITSALKSGERRKHSVKPLQIIWNKFPCWNAHNTVHLDDLSRNFALNPKNGLKVTGFYRKKKSGKRDIELLGLASYLERLAIEVNDFTRVKFKYWTDVLSGKKALIKEDDNDKKSANGN
ncbi:HAD-superfamily subfamily IIID h [Chaetoceros tenuissimus]|uniref:HAD-superfamily subfamily IIID h n=1 Tax=Chaetoceros tenuissimus TaxID=426638 RepID=A0AAD3H3R9_9STRA|nr:HAD-superfamily subfamily IIID h [Chaetoceros tenuissimus]